MSSPFRSSSSSERTNSSPRREHHEKREDDEDNDMPSNEHAAPFEGVLTIEFTPVKPDAPGSPQVPGPPTRPPSVHAGRKSASPPAFPDLSAFAPQQADPTGEPETSHELNEDAASRDKDTADR